MSTAPTANEEQAARALGAALLQFILAYESGRSLRRPLPTPPAPVQPLSPPEDHEATPRQLLLTVRQVAKLLSVSDRTVWTHTAPRGPIPAVRIGGSVRYTLEDLEAWIQQARNKGEALEKENA